MKDTYYFQHDYGARNDPKLQEVLIEHGAAGLGIFWCVVEQLYEQGGRLPRTVTKSIAFSLNVRVKIVESVIYDFGLFHTSDTEFWSTSVDARLERKRIILDKRKKAIQKRWGKKSTSAPKEETQLTDCHNEAKNEEIPKDSPKVIHMYKNSDTYVSENGYICIENGIHMNAFSDTKEKKGKERKEDPLPPMRGSKGDCKGGNDAEVAPQFCPPLVGEVRAYAEERGAVAFSAERFVAFYEAKGWMVGRNRMKSWQAAVRSWIARDRADERASGTSLTKTERNETVRASDERRASAERVVDVLLNGGV